MKTVHKSGTMAWALVLVACLFTLFITGCEGRGLKASDVPVHLIFRPTFLTPYGDFAAGTAFAVKGEDEQTLIVTAMHIFGPNGGLDREVLAEELPYFITKVLLVDVFDGSEIGFAEKVLLIPEAKSAPVNKDLAAFTQVSEGVGALTFAPNPVQVGEKVWLCSAVVGGAPTGQMLHEAVVVESTEDRILYKYKNQKLELRATSGSPVLNADGQVVGVNIGSGFVKGELHGVANPTSNVLRLLQSAK